MDQALSPVVRILAMVTDMAGDESRAAIWFKHQPIPGWAGKTAYDLVAEERQTGSSLISNPSGPASMPDIVLWRAYVPRWPMRRFPARGPARFGGRWNPIGLPTLYAARELSTAWAEYNQGFVQHPALIAQLHLTGAKLADLTQADTLEVLGLDAAIHDCQWRADWIRDGSRRRTVSRSV